MDRCVLWYCIPMMVSCVLTQGRWHYVSTYIFEVRQSKFIPMIGTIVSSLVRRHAKMAVCEILWKSLMMGSWDHEVFLLKINKWDRGGQRENLFFLFARKKSRWKLLRGRHVPYFVCTPFPPTKHDSTPKMYLYIQEVCSYFGQTGHTAAFLIMMIFRPARLCSGLNVFILRGVGAGVLWRFSNNFIFLHRSITQKLCTQQRMRWALHRKFNCRLTLLIYRNKKQL